MFCHFDGELERNLDFIGDILTAELVLAEAERAALSGVLGAGAPANGSHSGTICARWVAERTASDQALRAAHWNFMLCA